MASQDTLLTMVVAASLINVAGTQIPPWAGTGNKPTAEEQKAWNAHNHDPLLPIIAGFILGTIFLSIPPKLSGMAEGFAGAFLVTSLLLNGQSLIRGALNLLNATTGENNK